MRYLDLFAGAGGLSEGFIREGFEPVAHVELWEAACYTLKTRAAFHYLKKNHSINIYKRYLKGEIGREDLYSSIPKEILESVICREISDDSIQEIFGKIDKLTNQQTIDLILGGPPCQAYSLVGRARDPNGMKGDKRNYLFHYYVRFLEKYRPKYFVFENVLGLLSAKDKSGIRYFDVMQAEFEKCGYKVKHDVLSASDFGVLQNRNRVILVGKRTTEDFEYPRPNEYHPRANVGAVFSDLPVIHAGGGDVHHCNLSEHYDSWLDTAGIRSKSYPVTFHCARSNTQQDLEIYRRVVQTWNEEKRRLSYNELPDNLKTHANQTSFLDRFKVVAADERASQTVVAHICKDGHYYIHPDINQNRSITPREAARLQTFPDNYYFESESSKPSCTDAYKQIGNAVPVLLAQKIAAKLKEVWDE